MRIGLFFGSFNPLHNGHLKVAQTVLNETLCDEVWLVVSPQNPFKSFSSLLSKEERFQMVEKALVQERRIKACSIEFEMSVPSYTVDTLYELEKQYPENEFFLIMGEDNLQGFLHWKDWKTIASGFNIVVYPRGGERIKAETIPFQYTLVSAPDIDISSTEIRRLAKSGELSAESVPIAILSDIIHYYG